MSPAKLRSKPIFWVLVWLVCGLLASGILLNELRASRCITVGDLVAGLFLSCVGPVGLVVIGLVVLDKRVGCLIPQKRE